MNTSEFISKLRGKISVYEHDSEAQFARDFYLFFEHMKKKNKSIRYKR